jgi:hypothetical protein
LLSPSSAAAWQRKIKAVIKGLDQIGCSINRVASMLCRLCLEEKQLVRSHIVARCLLEPLGGDITVHSTEPGAFPARSPMGEYDSSILCAACDGMFSPWEEYAAEFLLRRAPSVSTNSQGSGYIVPNYDYSALKLCLLSIIWRMSITKRRVYAAISLGPFEHKLRDAILLKDAGGQFDFPILITRFTDKLGSVTMLGANPLKIDGVNLIVFGLPGYLITIKLDRRPFREGIKRHYMAPNQPLHVKYERIDRGPAATLMRRVFDNEEASYRTRQRR